MVEDMMYDYELFSIMLECIPQLDSYIGPAGYLGSPSTRRVLTREVFGVTYAALWLG